MDKFQLIAMLWTKQELWKCWQARSHQDLHKFSFRITGFVLPRWRYLTFSLTLSAIGASVRWLIGCLRKPRLHFFFQISVLRGVRHFVKMLTYEHCLLLIWVEISLVKLRFLAALDFVLRHQGDAFTKDLLLEILKVQTTHRNPSFQTR